MMQSYGQEVKRELANPKKGKYRLMVRETGILRPRLERTNLKKV
jgi:hypothetical protein